MKREDVDKMFVKAKEIKDETMNFFQRRKLNDMIDSRIGYFDREENFKKTSKDKGKWLKNVFVDKKDGQVVFTIYKDRYTDNPETDGDTYGPIEFSRCDTPDKMLGQIRYLLGFPWCTAGIIDQFITIVEAVYVGKTGNLLFTSTGR